MNIIDAKVLFQNDTLVAECNRSMSLNCADFTMGSGKDAWIKRTQGCCGDQGFPALTFQDPQDSSAIHGIWVESSKGLFGILIDAATPADVNTACNACCGTSTTVTPVYNGTLPADTSGALSNFCITRSDDGSITAIQNAYLDYQGQYATIRLFSNASGVSKYSVTATVKPIAINTDTVATGVCS